MVDKKGKKEGTEREEKVHVNDIRHCAIEVEAKSLCVKEKTREARGVRLCIYDITPDYCHCFLTHTTGIKYHALLPMGYSRLAIIMSCKKFQTFSIKLFWLF